MRDESKLPVLYRKKLPENLEKIKNGTYKKEDYDYPLYAYLKENDIKIDENGSDIIKFLRGKNILITGGTGFLGKLLIEKLIRCCKDIGTIYLIIRTKKNKDAQTRIEEFLDHLIFYKLSEIYPDYKKKVVGLSGDFAEPGIALSEESRRLIADNVNIIYHAAATVRFDEKIKRAVTINIKGTQEMINIAKSCKNLDVFVHVSTAFANCLSTHITESIYEPIMDPYELIDLVDKSSSKVLDHISNGLLCGMPNTYAFTKQIAETILLREAAGLPVCIHRPSIVVGTLREPIRSWVDNFFGPVGLIHGAACGLLHVMLGNPRGKPDFVPADYVINNCIAASYKTAIDKSPQIQIFNYTCPRTNQIEWRNLMANAKQAKKVAATFVAWKHFFVFTNNYYFYMLLHFLTHLFPAYIEIIISKIVGSKPILIKLYKKIDKFIEALCYFTLNQWTFDYNNTEALWKSLNDKDKKNFAFNINEMNWQDQFDLSFVCLREFLLSDHLDNLEEGRAYYKKIVIAHYSILALLIIGSLYFFINTWLCFIPVTLIFLSLYYGYHHHLSEEIKTDINKF